MGGGPNNTNNIPLNESHYPCQYPQPTYPQLPPKPPPKDSPLLLPPREDEPELAQQSRKRKQFQQRVETK